MFISAGDPKTISWVTFNLLILAFLFIDLKTLRKKSTIPTYKAALLSSFCWVVLAFLFGAWLIQTKDYDTGVLFFTAYLIEKSLGFDNIMVFSLVFAAFNIPLHSQYRVLFWGIMGALILRAVMIFAGIFFIQKFYITLYVFGLLLLLTGLKMLIINDEQKQIKKGFLWRKLQEWLPLSDQLQDSRFWIQQGHSKKATPLLTALILIEVSDIIFAVDSIPAVFAITTDPFIVYTSNVFAILGLRSLYFLLANALVQFFFLKKGLALILCFVSLKMLGILSINPVHSLMVMGIIFLLSIICSLKKYPYKSQS